MTQIPVAIVGAGPYGLSLAAHFNARGVDHRIFGRSMQFWSEVANAGGERYLKSFCFGTNISIPSSGYRFNDFNAARDLPTTEPCSIANFAAYGRWVQQENVPWLEQLDVVRITIVPGGFELCLSDGEKVKANRVIIATGLSFYASLPSVLKQLSPAFLSHTSTISNFAAFKGLSVVTVGAGQSALEAAALIHEAGATSQLLVRDDAIAWNTRIERSSNFWQRLRSPVSPLGTGPKAWLLAKFPGAMHRVPANTRRKFIESYLPPDGAWWLKNRVVDHVVLPHRNRGHRSEAYRWARPTRRARQNVRARMETGRRSRGRRYRLPN